MKTTIRIPAQSAQVVAGHFGYGVDILAQVRLDTLADALNAMEHDDTDPGERPMNADQCRDALLRELLAGWSPSELVEARIPGVLRMADEIATLRRERDEARARLEDWETFRRGFENLSYHSEGMGCGIEDRGITDRYRACEHGWDCAMERVAEWIPEEIDTTPSPGTQA